jgi:HSP20 family protein
MDIIKWRPFQDFDRFFEGDDLFPVIPAVSRKSKPSMNVYRTNDSVVAEVALEGMDPKNVEASIENDVLTVKGEEKSEKETKEKNYYFKEIRSGSFSRSIALPAHVKAGEAKAESKDGILKITVPIDEKKTNKKIPIEVGK